MNMETTLVYYTTFAGMQRETIFTVVSKLTTLSSVKISICFYHWANEEPLLGLRA